MTGDFVKFGDASRLQIAFRLVADREPPESRPLEGGSTLGDISITISHQTLTRHTQAGRDMTYVRWYLLPVFQWIVRNWVDLFHEERLPSSNTKALTAASTSAFAMSRLIASSDPQDREQYQRFQDWWSRHSIRAADPSALYPDLFVRRLEDYAEVSWTARQPAYAPDGFAFTLSPGSAVFPIEQIAEPLWKALQWFIESDVAAPQDREALIALKGNLSALNAVEPRRFAEAYIPCSILDKIRKSPVTKDLEVTRSRLLHIPVVTRFDDAVIMFGGVDPDISQKDTNALLNFLQELKGGEEQDNLSEKADDMLGPPLGSPHLQGYELAEDALDEMGLPNGASLVDIAAVLETLGIEVVERDLETGSIRGVAVAGAGYCPAILVNRTSLYNRNEAGRRFTCAHELCHILYDRGHAKRVTHTSGPWAPVSVEKRANAFAAMFLMPRPLLRAVLSSGRLSKEETLQAARQLQVNYVSLVHHLHNLGLIDEITYDQLQDLEGTFSGLREAEVIRPKARTPRSDG